MNRARSFRSAMTANAAWKGEFLEEGAQSVNVFAFVRINLGVCAFQIDRPQHAGCAVPWTSKEHCVEIILLDQAVQVNVSKAQVGTGTPVSEQPVLDVLRLQGLPQ